MADIKASSLSLEGAEIGQAILLSETLPPDFTFGNMRFLRAGLVETDNSKFDVNIFSQDRLYNRRLIDIAPFSVTSDILGSTYGAGQFMVCGDSGKIATASVAFSIWTERTTPTTQILYDVSYCPTAARFIAVGNGGTILSSPDGDSWADFTNAARGLVGRVLETPSGTVIATTRSLTEIYRGFPAFDIVTLPAANLVYDIACGGGLVVLAGGNGQIYYSDDDGLTFNSVVISGSTHLYNIEYFNGKFIAVQYGTNPNAYVSDDAVNWTLQTDIFNSAGVSALIGSLTKINDMLLIGFQNGKFATTTDGENWIIQDPFVQTYNVHSFSLDPSRNEVILVGQDATGNLLNYGKFAGSTTSFTENGESQYIRIS